MASNCLELYKVWKPSTPCWALSVPPTNSPHAIVTTAQAIALRRLARRLCCLDRSRGNVFRTASKSAHQPGFHYFISEAHDSTSYSFKIEQMIKQNPYHGQGAMCSNSQSAVPIISRQPIIVMTRLMPRLGGGPSHRGRILSACVTKVGDNNKQIDANMNTTNHPAGLSPFTDMPGPSATTLPPCPIDYGEAADTATVLASSRTPSR